MYLVRTQYGRVPPGTLDLGESTRVLTRYTTPGIVMGFINPRTDPPRDEDQYYGDDEWDHDSNIVESLEHHCVVLTLDQWVCEDCGSTFDRDSSLGDEPEECIIESDGDACVAYVPDN